MGCSFPLPRGFVPALENLRTDLGIDHEGGSIMAYHLGFQFECQGVPARLTARLS